MANGQNIQTYETLDALLAFDLPTGEYTLELNYMPSEYKIGTIISLFGALSLVLIIIADGITKRKHNKITLPNDKE